MEGFTQAQLDERAAIINEGYEETPATSAPQEPEPAEIEAAEEIGANPENHVDAAEDNDPGSDPLVEQIKALEARLSSVDSLAERLKQAERRVGGLTNKLRDEEARRKALESAPTKEEIEQAAADDKKLEELREADPDLADAIAIVQKRMEAKITGKPADIDVDSIRNALETDFDKRLTSVQQNFEIRLVEMAHKDFKTVARSKEFADWVKSEPEIIKARGRSERAEDVIEILDEFKREKKSAATVNEVRKRNKERLERSVEAKRTSQTSRNKSEADMTPEELRRHLLKKGYDED